LHLYSLNDAQSCGFFPAQEAMIALGITLGFTVRGVHN
jgi:hypothetical protein